MSNHFEYVANKFRPCFLCILFVISFFCGSPVYSADVVLISRDESTDIQNHVELKQELTNLFSELGHQVEVREAGFISDYPYAINFPLDPGDKLMGMFIFSHGTPQNIQVALNDKASFFDRYFLGKTQISGTELADYLASQLPLDQIGDQFFVDLYSCNSGSGCLIGDGYQKSFTDRFVERLKQQGKNLKQLLVFGFTSRTRGYVHHPETMLAEGRRLGAKGMPLLEKILSKERTQANMGSPFRKLFRWGLVPYAEFIRASSVIFGTYYIGQTLYGHTGGVLTALASYLYGVVNGFDSPTEARVIEWTPEKSFIEEKATINTLMTNKLKKVSCSVLFE